MLYVKCYTGLSCTQNVQLFLSKEEPLSSLGYFRNMTQMLYWESRQQKKKKKEKWMRAFFKTFFFFSRGLCLHTLRICEGLDFISVLKFFMKVTKNSRK